MYIFETSKPQKLTLTIASLWEAGVDVLQLAKCTFSINSLHKLVRDNKMRVPLDGSIVDDGTKSNIRVFFYKFNKEHTTPCSKASSDDFSNMICIENKEWLLNSPTKLGRNIAWSFLQTHV